MEKDIYKKLIKSGPFGYGYQQLVYNEKGDPVDYIYLEVNETFGKLTGLDTQKIIGKKVSEVIPGILNDPYNWIEKFTSVAIKGGSEEFQSYSTALDRYYKVHVISDEIGYFTTIFFDITDLYTAQKALAESENRFQNFMEMTPVYAYIKDASLNHIYLNKRINELTLSITGEAGEIKNSRAIFSDEIVEKIEIAD